MSNNLTPQDNVSVDKGAVTLHKFGGSSLADPSCYRRVAKLLIEHGKPTDIVVVSAAGKTTNHLLEIIDLAMSGSDYHDSVCALIDYQRELINQLLDKPQPLLTVLDNDCENLTAWLATTSHDQYTVNRIVGCGEVWSSRLLSALLNQYGRYSCAIDARQFLVAEGSISPTVNEGLSQALLHELCLETAMIQRVITGYICRNNANQTLTLGRNGSDYSATLIAKLAGASIVNIWTDVAGVYSADPNLLNEAKLIERLSLAEAEELARLGNPVLHHRTLQPLVQDNIALRVRSSFKPNAAFTEIGKRLGHVGDCIVSGSTAIKLYIFDDNDLNDQMINNLSEYGFFPLMCTRHHQQIILVIPLEIAGRFESHLTQVGNITYRSDGSCGVVSLLDAGVSWYRKLFSKIFAKESKWPIVLSENGLSLSVIVPAKQVNILTYVLHHKIYSSSKQLGIMLIGVGNIGQQWLTLFHEQQAQLERYFNISIPLIGIARSNQAVIDFKGISPNNWRAALNSTEKQVDSSHLLSRLSEHSLDELIVLDVSADQGVSDRYMDYLHAGFHVISANKLAGSGLQSDYSELKQLAYSHKCKWLYNASVGAGLPVLDAINDLSRSGHNVESISGVFSGTLSWLFAHYDNTVPFSTLLLKAQAMGITEPDPRDDLSGKDKQRKLLILARECGFNLELDDISLESMVPDELATLSLPEFIARASQLDDLFSRRYQAAARNGQVIRYVAQFKVEAGKLVASVGLETLAVNHPFAALTPSDNIFLITTQWYQDNPLIIRGPGAGREVTAAAIESDLYTLVKDLS